MGHRSLASIALCFVASLACSSPVDLSTADREWDLWPRMSVDFTGTHTLSGTITPDTVRGWLGVQLVVTNPSASDENVDLGACSLAIRLYPRSGLQGNPAWDNRPAPNTNCPDILLLVTVRAHDSTAINAGIITTTGLSGSVPAGHYFAAVAFRTAMNGPVQLVPAGAVDIP